MSGKAQTYKRLFAVSLIVAISSSKLALAVATSSLVIPMQLVNADGTGKSIGTITAVSTKCGVKFTPNLHDLPPGVHGYHVHMNPSCADHGMAAGGHLDPAHTNSHEGPYADNKKGHLGDLPILVVDKDGTATLPTLAPRLTLSMIKNHAIMIHAGGDNYSDKPEKLGGGGERIACGVVPK